MADDDYYGNSLEIGGEIHKQSNIIQRFNHIPKDTKYSFFDRADKMNYYYKSSAYQTYYYIRKNLMLSKLEVIKYLKDKKEIYDCKNENQLAAYFKKNNKNYLWNIIKDLDKKDREEAVKEILEQLNRSRIDGYVQDIYTEYDNFMSSYKEYLKQTGSKLEDAKTDIIDDIGLLHFMMTTTEVAKAYKGQAIKSMNTTISVNRETTPEEDAEEEPEQAEGGFKNKFFKKRD